MVDQCILACGIFQYCIYDCLLDCSIKCVLKELPVWPYIKVKRVTGHSNVMLILEFIEQRNVKTLRDIRNLIVGREIWVGI